MGHLIWQPSGIRICVYRNLIYVRQRDPDFCFFLSIIFVLRYLFVFLCNGELDQLKSSKFIKPKRILMIVSKY